MSYYLRRCPFCGEVPDVRKRGALGPTSDNPKYHAYCLTCQCGASMFSPLSEHAVVMMWNNRTHTNEENSNSAELPKCKHCGVAVYPICQTCLTDCGLPSVNSLPCGENNNRYTKSISALENAVKKAENSCEKNPDNDALKYRLIAYRAALRIVEEIDFA